jgi:hypothetical protein
VLQRPELAAARAAPLDPDATVDFARGTMQRTDYGRQFAESVGIMVRRTTSDPKTSLVAESGIVSLSTRT